MLAALSLSHEKFWNVFSLTDDYILGLKVADFSKVREVIYNDHDP